MESIIVEILNPKAKRLLKDLADLKLISISKSKTDAQQFINHLNKLRVDNPPSFEEITQEVEVVRAKRYGKKG